MLDTVDSPTHNTPQNFRGLSLVEISRKRELLPVEGEHCTLKMIKFKDLLVDATYQRDITRLAEDNIQVIFHEFSWRKFIPTAVCEITDPRMRSGKYAIIDGQCRSTAAFMRYKLVGDIGDEIPCFVIKATVKEAAACFAAINGNVTSISKLQLYVSKLAAGDAKTESLEKLLSDCGVRVLPFVVNGKYNPGDTMALGTIESCIRQFGPKVVKTALTAITQTRDGNPGSLRAPVIKALCQLIYNNPGWLDSPIIVNDVLELLPLHELLYRASFEAAKTKTPVPKVILSMLREHFATHLEGVIEKLRVSGVID